MIVKSYNPVNKIDITEFILIWINDDLIKK